MAKLVYNSNNYGSQVVYLQLRGVITQLKTEGAPPCRGWKKAGFQSVFVGVKPHVSMHDKDILQLKLVVLVPNCWFQGTESEISKLILGPLKQQMDRTATENIK